MHRRKQGPIALSAALLLAATVATAQEKKPAEGEHAPAKPAKEHAGFEKLKQLAGEWEYSKPPADEKGEHKDAPSTVVVYKTIAAGSAVQETLFPGTPHEMVTMYHLDGDDLMLTHYCAAGNQPQMKAEKSADSNKLEFKFAGGTNMDPAKDTHMHELTLTFTDADHLRADWTTYQNGKSAGVTTFELKRKK